MLASALGSNGLRDATLIKASNNHLRDPKYNYNETTITRDIDYYREPDFNDNAKLSRIDTLKNPTCQEANVYVGMKNIRPLNESKGFTGLEHLASGKNNRNVLKFKDTFGPQEYYTYL